MVSAPMAVTNGGDTPVTCTEASGAVCTRTDDMNTQCRTNKSENARQDGGGEETASDGGRDGRCGGSGSKMPDMTLSGVQVEQNCPPFRPHRRLFTLHPVSFFDLSYYLSSKHDPH